MLCFRGKTKKLNTQNQFWIFFFFFFPCKFPLLKGGNALSKRGNALFRGGNVLLNVVRVVPISRFPGDKARLMVIIIIIVCLHSIGNRERIQGEMERRTRKNPKSKVDLLEEEEEENQFETNKSNQAFSAWHEKQTKKVQESKRTFIVLDSQVKYPGSETFSQ